MYDSSTKYLCRLLRCFAVLWTCTEGIWRRSSSASSLLMTINEPFPSCKIWQHSFLACKQAQKTSTKNKQGKSARLSTQYILFYLWIRPRPVVYDLINCRSGDLKLFCETCLSSAVFPLFSNSINLVPR